MNRAKPKEPREPIETVGTGRYYEGVEIRRAVQPNIRPRVQSVPIAPQSPPKQAPKAKVKK